nr:MAG TPA_asm: collagen alpha 1(VIII) chain protein [Bacteriophage sp.]
MDILVNVVNQKLKIATNLKSLVAGTQEFVRFVFNTSGDWDGLATFAQFMQDGIAYNQYLDENKAAYLPAEIGVGNCTVMLYGSGGKTIATTNYLTLKVDDNILISDAQSTEISESLYAQLVDKVNSYTTPTIGDNGNWHIGGIDTGKPSRGANGDKGDAGATGPAGPVGPQGPAGAPGKDGTAGANGVTPHIGNNGNWYIGSTDTGKPSRGVAGAKGSDGARGEKGADGKTPVRGTDYWTAADKQEIVNSVIAALPDGTEVSY